MATKRTTRSATARATKPAKASLIRHRLFPAIVAVWVGGLLGLGSLAVGGPIIEQLVTATGVARFVPQAAPPLGLTARMLIALGLFGVGAIGGFILGRLIGGAPREVSERKAARHNKSAPDKAERPTITPPAPGDTEARSARLRRREPLPPIEHAIPADRPALSDAPRPVFDVSLLELDQPLDRDTAPEAIHNADAIDGVEGQSAPAALPTGDEAEPAAPAEMPTSPRDDAASSIFARASAAAPATISAAAKADDPLFALTARLADAIARKRQRDGSGKPRSAEPVVLFPGAAATTPTRRIGDSTLDAAEEPALDDSEARLRTALETRQRRRGAA